MKTKNRKGSLTMERKKDLLLDIDEVFCFSGFLQAINDFLGTSYEVDDFTDYYMDEAVIPKERMDEFNKFLNQRNLYENAQILPYAVETLKKLNEFYHIYVCSSCINPFDVTGSARLFADKYNFLIASLPFLKPERFIFTNVKHLLKADVQIDDRLSNLNERIETKILFPSYHNKNISEEELGKKGILRAGYDWREGWLEVENILLPQLQSEEKKATKYLKK